MSGLCILPQGLPDEIPQAALHTEPWAVQDAQAATGLHHGCHHQQCPGHVSTRIAPLPLVTAPPGCHLPYTEAGTILVRLFKP